MATGGSSKHKGTANLRPWKPGQSGNPTGVSKPCQELTKALEGDWKEVHAKLQALLRSPDEKIATEVAKFYVDHIKGKAKQAITGEDGGPIQVDMGMVEMLRKLAAP